MSLEGGFENKKTQEFYKEEKFNKAKEGLKDFRKNDPDAYKEFVEGSEFSPDAALGAIDAAIQALKKGNYEELKTILDTIPEGARRDSSWGIYKDIPDSLRSLDFALDKKEPGSNEKRIQQSLVEKMKK